jgi:outer membrane protein assembly factor BamA
LSGDNGWGEFQQSFYRSQGSLPYQWRRNGNLYKQGGGNVRGYSLIENSTSLLAPKIAAINIDITIPNPLETLYLPVIEDMNPVFFADYGAVWEKDMPAIKSFKKSFGIGIVWDAFFYLDYLFNLEQVRMDFPIWLSDVPNDEKNIALRWLIRFDFRY